MQHTNSVGLFRIWIVRCVGVRGDAWPVLLSPCNTNSVGLFRILRGCVALEYGLVSFGMHCFLRLAHALYGRSRRCLTSAAFSVQHQQLHAAPSLQSCMICFVAWFGLWPMPLTCMAGTSSVNLSYRLA